MQLHLAATPDTAIGPDAFERRSPGRTRHATRDRDAPPHPQFAHVISGDGYSAGYYSYLWADTLTADAWEAFQERHAAPGIPASPAN
ncbi:MAG: M3 family metallopeptidase [Steroidobacteraceae bacterium]